MPDAQQSQRGEARHETPLSMPAVVPNNLVVASITPSPPMSLLCM
jgi:hypothetical protein